MRERGQGYAVSHELGAGRERNAGKRAEICGESLVGGRGVWERGQRYAVSNGLRAGREGSAGKRIEICVE